MKPKTQTPLSYDELLELTTLQRKKIMKIRIVSVLLIINICVWSVAYIKAKSFYNDYYDLLIQVANKKTAVALASTTEPEKPLTNDEYIKQNIEAAGLKWSDVKCLLDHENGSRNPYGIYVNKPGAGYDRGLFMWNSISHPEVTNACAFDVACATKRFIEVVKQDQNYHQWHGYTKFCK